MANVSSGNSFYVDSTGSLSSLNNIKVLGVTLTATAANAVLVLTNNDGTAATRMDLRNANAGTTVQFRFDQAPIVFSTGVKVATVTNCNATVVYAQNSGGGNP